MSTRKWLGVALVTLSLGGCVLQSDFDAYRATIKADGDALDEWVAATHQWIVFINANINTICPGCSPPPLPPDPPPDGEWQ
jgi:hypothetical protein